jgi:Fic-DOC domain mobile mystery protein B
MGLTFDYPPGATPLDPDEVQGLIPKHISTQGQLNEWEYQNILEAQQWVSGLRRTDLLSLDFMRVLHKRMFGNTWRWAGEFRTSEKSIGVAPEQISVRVRLLCGDVIAQQQHNSYPPLERAARFHHRLVLIHPFPNGNGRFSRMMADLILMQSGHLAFAWGEGDLVNAGDTRSRYIAALQAADAGNYGTLLKFLRITA